MGENSPDELARRQTVTDPDGEQIDDVWRVRAAEVRANDPVSVLVDACGASGSFGGRGHGFALDEIRALLAPEAGKLRTPEPSGRGWPSNLSKALNRFL